MGDIILYTKEYRLKCCLLQRIEKQVKVLYGTAAVSIEVPQVVHCTPLGNWEGFVRPPEMQVRRTAWALGFPRRVNRRGLPRRRKSAAVHGTAAFFL